MPNLTSTELSAWRGLLDTYSVLAKALDAELASDGLSLTEYDVLVRVEEAGTAGIRMSELASRLGLSGGGLTRLADRLEAQGYLARRRCPADGRGFEILLTAVGKTKLKRVHVKHLRAVRALFVDRLTPAEVGTMAAVWRKLAAGAAPAPRGDTT